MIYLCRQILFLLIVYETLATSKYYYKKAGNRFDVYYGPGAIWGYKEFKPPKSYRASFNNRGERPGRCEDVGFLCNKPFLRAETEVFECDVDFQCPSFYKCCRNRCFLHKICEPAAYTNQDIPGNIIVSSTTFPRPTVSVKSTSSSTPYVSSSEYFTTGHRTTPVMSTHATTKPDYNITSPLYSISTWIITKPSPFSSTTKGFFTPVTSINKTSTSKAYSSTQEPTTKEYSTAISSQKTATVSKATNASSTHSTIFSTKVTTKQSTSTSQPTEPYNNTNIPSSEVKITSSKINLTTKLSTEEKTTSTWFPATSSKTSTVSLNSITIIEVANTTSSPFDNVTAAMTNASSLTTTKLFSTQITTKPVTSTTSTEPFNVTDITSSKTTKTSMLDVTTQSTTFEVIASGTFSAPSKNTTITEAANTTLTSLNTIANAIENVSNLPTTKIFSTQVTTKPFSSTVLSTKLLITTEILPPVTNVTTKLVTEKYDETTSTIISSSFPLTSSTKGLTQSNITTNSEGTSNQTYPSSLISTWKTSYASPQLPVNASFSTTDTKSITTETPLELVNTSILSSTTSKNENAITTVYATNTVEGDVTTVESFTQSSVLANFTTTGNQSYTKESEITDDDESFSGSGSGNNEILGSTTDDEDFYTASGDGHDGTDMESNTTYTTASIKTSDIFNKTTSTLTTAYSGFTFDNGDAEDFNFSSSTKSTVNKINEMATMSSIKSIESLDKSTSFLTTQNLTTTSDKNLSSYNAEMSSINQTNATTEKHPIETTITEETKIESSSISKLQKRSTTIQPTSKYDFTTAEEIMSLSTEKSELTPENNTDKSTKSPNTTSRRSSTETWNSTIVQVTEGDKVPIIGDEQHKLEGKEWEKNNTNIETIPDKEKSETKKTTSQIELPSQNTTESVLAQATTQILNSEKNIILHSNETEKYLTTVPLGISSPTVEPQQISSIEKNTTIGVTTSAYIPPLEGGDNKETPDKNRSTTVKEASEMSNNKTENDKTIKETDKEPTAITVKTTTVAGENITTVSSDHVVTLNNNTIMIDIATEKTTEKVDIVSDDEDFMGHSGSGDDVDYIGRDGSGYGDDSGSGDEYPKIS